MRAPSQYERYLLNERFRYGVLETENNEFPCWLQHELDTFNWLFRLSRTLHEPFKNHYVSGQLLWRIENIETIRYRKLKNISPSLQKAIEQVVEILVGLNSALDNEDMWKGKHYLSRKGFGCWENAVHRIHDCLWGVEPDPDWREQWEKENLAPLCTRREAEKYVSAFIKKEYGLKSSKEKYIIKTAAKGKEFQLTLKNSSDFKTILVVTFDMIRREVLEVN